MDFMDVEKLKNSLKSALNEIAKPIANTPFTRENYNRLFPYSRIKTPIENAATTPIIARVIRTSAKVKPRFFIFLPFVNLTILSLS